MNLPFFWQKKINNLGDVGISLLYILLLIIVGITSWYALNTAKKTVELHVVSDTNPDFFMNNISYIQMDDDGAILNQITTSKVLHYQKDDVYFFTKPFLSMLDKNKQVWQIVADSGTSNGNEKVVFNGNVQINQLLGKDNKALGTNVVTTSATIYPNEKIAQTDHPVAIKQGASTVNAIGARLDFKNSKLELKSNVKGQYESKK